MGVPPRPAAWTVLALTGTEAPSWGEQAAVHGGWLGVAERVMLLTVTSWPIRVAIATGGDRRRPAVAVGVAGLALAGPAVFVGGLLAAQAAQPGPGAGDRSLSALAGGDATSAWIMTLTLVLVGALSVAVAIGLRGVPAAARAVLGTAGGMLVLAAAVPQPPGGTSVTHMVVAGLAWAGFVAWPLVLAGSRGVAHRLRWTSAVATGVLLVLAAGYAAQLVTGGTWYGFSQRLLLLALAVWPARVALAAVRHPGDAGARAARRGPVARDEAVLPLARPTGSPGR